VLSVILKKKTVKIDFFFLEEFCSLPVRIKSDIDSVGYKQHYVVFQCLPIVLQQKEILDSFETTRVRRFTDLVLLALCQYKQANKVPMEGM